MKTIPLIALVAGLLVGAASLGFAAGRKPVWSVPGKAPVEIADVQYSLGKIYTSRTVQFRSKYASLDSWGDLKVYPVVRAPNGRQFRGFARRFPAGTLGDRFIAYSFPFEFAAPHSSVERIEDAAGETLVDGEPRQLLPPGRYYVKWVFNEKVVDTGDSFPYEYKELGPLE